MIRPPRMPWAVLACTAGLVACGGPRAAEPHDARETAHLTALAREQPDSVREAISIALLRATTASGDARESHLANAHSLATAYAAAWTDSFHVRRVARFQRASAAQRRDIAVSDSLRDAARIVAGRDGIPAAMPLWQESLRRGTAANDSAGRAAALYSLGAGYYLASELDSATVHLDRALTLARAIGDLRTIGNALGTLANVSRELGQLTEAAELYEEASTVRGLSGDTRGMAADANNLGLIARGLADLDGARQWFERALELNRSGGRDRPAALNLANLGDLASIQGDYAAAQSFYDEALAINRATGDLAETGFVLHDLGLLAARRGDHVRARETLMEAQAMHERSGALLEVVAVRRDLAAVQAAMGDLETAVSTLGDAMDGAIASGAPSAVRAGLALTRADLAVQLGAMDRANDEYARADRLFAEAGDDAGRADAQSGRALLMLLRGDHAAALGTLERVATAQAGSRDPRAAALTQLLTADVLREMGDTAAARRTLVTARGTLEQLGDAGGESAALSSLGDLALLRGAPLAAEAFYRRGLARLADRPIPDVRWRLHAGLAGALRSRNALDAAAQELRAAIAAVEDVASRLRVEDRRPGFLSDKWQVYAALARVEQERGRPGEAFAISERMRGRQMLAMLDRARVRTRRESSAHEQDLRRRINEITREIEDNARGGGRREPSLTMHSMDAAREALDALHREYAALLVELRDREPGWADLVSAEPVDWHAAADRLGPDRVLIQYLLSDSASTVFVVTADSVAAIDLGATRGQIASLVDFARHAMARPDGPSLWRGPLRRLHDRLIAPVERSGLLHGARTLVIVPHAELHFLPFGALLAQEPDDRFLVERFELVYAPSASVWLRHADRDASRRPANVLALAPHTARLPATAGEVEGIRNLYGRHRTTVLTGAAASERALRMAAPHYDILHLATYGVLNKHNPLFSYIELAPDRNDGRLEAHEVFDLELDGQLVVLSACQTAVASGAIADIPAGDDWVGLMQAFLQAGAGSVLASLWAVDDVATARLMQRFYRELAAGVSDAAALAGAQRAILRERSSTHPFYWAGFTLSGSRPDRD